MGELGYFYLFICVTLVLPDLEHAADGLASWSAARQNCSSRLPDLSSVRDGSLLRQLENYESTWIDVHLEKAPWTWHLDENLIVGNHGCVAIDSNFNKLFQLKSIGAHSDGCLQKCQELGQKYAALQPDRGQLKCHCGDEVPPSTEDSNCDEQCPEWPSICGTTGYARIMATAGAYEDTGNAADRCTALTYRSGSAEFIQSDCRESTNKAICVEYKDGFWSFHVSTRFLSWFGAQTFCQGFALNAVHQAVKLHISLADELKHGHVNTSFNYWTQRSAFHFNPEDSFDHLLWAIDQPSFRIATDKCIRAQRVNDDIELSSSNCDIKAPYICPSVSGTTQTTTQTQGTTTFSTTTTEKSDPALAIGSSVGGLICVATIVIVLFALYVHRKRQPSSATPDQNNQTGNVYEEISEINREMHPYQPVMQSQMNNAQNKLISNPVYESSAPNSHPLEGQRAVYENTMRVSKTTSDETGHI